MTMNTLLGLLAFVTLSAQGAGVTFHATATVSAPGKKASVPVTIHVDRFVTDGDREKVVAAVRANDAKATTAALASMPDIGYITVLEKRTPIKYAYARPTGDGRLVTVVTAVPIYFVGGAEKDAKPKTGYDLGLALLVLDARDAGDGELAPAVTVKAENGAIVTNDYGREVVRLVNVTRAAK
jgi:hypothetical protein